MQDKIIQFGGFIYDKKKRQSTKISNERTDLNSIICDMISVLSDLRSTWDLFWRTFGRNKHAKEVIFYEV